MSRPARVHRNVVAVWEHNHRTGPAIMDVTRYAVRRTETTITVYAGRAAVDLPIPAGRFDGVSPAEFVAEALAAALAWDPDAGKGAAS